MNEIECYIKTCRDISQNGEYTWWSRLAEILASTQELVVSTREIAYDFVVQEAMGNERTVTLDKALEAFAENVEWDKE